MVFSSILFLLLFLPIALLFYFSVFSNLKNTVLLLLSLIFYTWGEGFYVVIMLASISINYVAGLLIEHYREKGVSRYFYYGTITINLGLLATFKYSNFLVDNINVLLALVSIEPVLLAPVHLPIGISFFTFQAISYIIDIYRGDNAAVRNPINMGLYIASFPQLIAGPIVRYHTIADQIPQRQVTVEKFAYGVKRFIIGLGKKVLIANTLSVVVDQIYSLPESELSFFGAWLGILCYTLQIYFDFSGYSDMAIGLGYMFGFKFMENFNYPYISQSMQDFWRRWHISLTSFIRDYLFLPIAIKRRYWGKWGIIYAFIISFSLVGLWHGASWNFILWGMLHGVFLITEHLGFTRVLIRFPTIFKLLYVHFVLALSWPLFRADTLSNAWAHYKAMFGFSSTTGLEYQTSILITYPVITAIFFGLIFSTPVYQVIEERFGSKPENGTPSTSNPIYALSSALILGVIFFASVLSLSAGAYNPFIYFRF
ncbi:MAG: membrane-bound O-acyltransferase family protein [Pseudomonadales bacterium]|nr:membrane-bound O-acyltransferase family protein [Pseudomonadales bacterium]